MSINLNKITEFHQRVFRNIQGQLNTGDEFDDLTAHTKAKALAHRLSERGTILNLKEVHYHAIDFIFNKDSWPMSRFSNGSYPVWYSSVDLNTSFYETSYHWKKTFIDAPQQFAKTASIISTTRKVFTVACNAALIDLREYAKYDYTDTQELGLRIYQEGYPGLISKSVRATDGENIAVFRKTILSSPEFYRDFIYEYDLVNNEVNIKNISSDELIIRIKE